MERIKVEEKFHKFKHAGAVDADGHILEPADLWENYIEEKYKPKALRLRRDQQGVEYIEIGGRPSKFQRGERLSRFAAMGSVDRNHDLPTGMTYGQLNPLGAMDPKERVERLDKEGLDAALIYPTLSLSYETELQDVELAQAYTRAYNRWIADFCRDSGGRLVPIAHLSLGDPQAAARELERAVKDGCKGAWVCQFVMTRKPHAHPDHDVVFAKAQELDIPFGIHPSLEPIWALPGRYEYEHLRGRTFFLNVTASDAVRHGLTSFFQFGTFRPLSEAQARYPGSRRRMDQLLARPDGRSVRQHRRANGAAQGASELLLQAQRLDFGRPRRAFAARDGAVVRGGQVLLGIRLPACRPYRELHGGARRAGGQTA